MNAFTTLFVIAIFTTLVACEQPQTTSPSVTHLLRKSARRRPW